MILRVMLIILVMMKMFFMILNLIKNNYIEKKVVLHILDRNRKKN